MTWSLYSVVSSPPPNHVEEIYCKRYIDVDWLNLFFKTTWPAIEQAAQDVILQTVIPQAKKALPNSVKDWNLDIQAKFGHDAPYFQNISAVAREDGMGRSDLDIMIDLVANLKESKIVVGFWSVRKMGGSVRTNRLSGKEEPRISFKLSNLL